MIFKFSKTITRYFSPRVLIVVLYACVWSNVTGAGSGKIRNYYITAEDMVRDYAPSFPNNPMMGMVSDNPGEWMYHCHVNDHIEAGMMGRYIIHPVSPDP